MRYSMVTGYGKIKPKQENRPALFTTLEKKKKIREERIHVAWFMLLHSIVGTAVRHD